MAFDKAKVREVAERLGLQSYITRDCSLSLLERLAYVFYAQGRADEAAQDDMVVPSVRKVIGFEAKEIGMGDWYAIPLEQRERIHRIMSSPEHFDFRWVYSSQPTLEAVDG